MDSTNPDGLSNDDMEMDHEEAEEEKDEQDANISDGAVSDNVSVHSRHSVQEAMKGEQVHFGMDAMEALGGAAAGLRESDQPLNAKERHT